jgi:hypothetical protein
MVNLKPAREITAQKCCRMNIIRERLKEKPMPSREICSIVFRSSFNRSELRTIQNYLTELIDLNLISYDPSSDVYSSNENKIVFQSKHDYDIALKHSRLLVFSTSDKQRLDQMDHYAALELLVHQDKENVDVDDQCLLQHVKTGYYELFSLLDEYRKKINEMGFSVSISLLKLERTFPERIDQERIKEELVDLRDLLVGKIYSIVNDVRNGIPLQGSCDCCPGLKITIKDARR